MLTFVLASLLAAPPAGEAWFTTLRPAVVVEAEEAAPALDSAEPAETRMTPAETTPRLAPAKTLAPKIKAKTRKARSIPQASGKGR